MKRMRRLFLTTGMTAIVALLVAADSSYMQSIREWQENRDKILRQPDSWLTLVGLFWLKPGDNTVGSADSSDFVLPRNSAPAYAGVLHLQRDRVTFTDPQGSTRTLSYDEDNPDIQQAGHVSFYVIKRDGRLAIRVKDPNSPARKNFHGMTYFPIDRAFHFDAKFIADAKKIPILDILGKTALEESPGIVEFTYQGNAYRLRPIYEGNTLFFLFKDPTNKADTYQAGRMLNTPLAAEGKVDLDFNRSYNPPCTFTPYATCPLPPKSNTLPFPVEAGEKRYAEGHVESAAR